MKWQEINYRFCIGIVVFVLHCTNGAAEMAKLYTGNNFSSSLVNCIAQDKYKYVWIGTEHGLNRFDGYKFVQYFYDESDKTTITDDGITTLFCDRNGNLWVGTDKGICRYDYEKNSFVRYYSPDYKFRTNSITQLSNGRILIGSAGRGVFMINNIHSHTLIKLRNTNRSYTDNFCSRIFLDKNNHLWMGNHSNHITKNIIEGTNITKLSEYKNNYGTVVEFLTLDNTGFIVVCRHGILYYDYSTQAFSDAGYDLSLLPEDFEITSAIINYRGDICIGTSGQGFWLIHSGSKTIVPSLSNQNHKNVATSTIYGFLDDYDKNLWIGCYQEGLVKVQNTKEVFGELAISDIPDKLSYIKKLFPNNNINTAIQDANKTYYISNYGKGMIIYNPVDKQMEYMNMFQKNRKGGFLTNDWINTFYIDSRQMLWIGTSSGVSCMNLADRSFVKYGWNEILADNTCNSICEDESGNIVIGTNQGLYYYHRKNNKVYHYPKSEQLRKLIICAMTKDKNGDIWISTSMGIWQWNKQKQVFISYINGNGLRTKEYLKNDAISLPDGKIGFRHYYGYTTFHPDEVKNNIIYLDKVYLSNITIDGKSINHRQDYYEVEHDEGNFVFEYSLMNFQSTENITFQYRINKSKKWATLPEGTNSIYLNRVEPGKYTIEVRAMCNGIYSSTNNIVKLKVCYPWYLSLWAIVLYATILTTLVIFFSHYHKKKKLSELDEQKMQFLINITHDIRSPLTLILEPLKKLSARTHDAESQNEIEIIEKNAKRLQLLVNQILDENRITKNLMHLHCEETNIFNFVSNICRLYNYSAKSRNIQFKLNCADRNLMVWVDHVNFEKVVNNLLTNAFKYTFDGGMISVSITHDDSRMKIEFMDNGIGLKETNPNKLFDRFYQGSNANEYHLEGTGIGLNLSKSIVKMHGGTITAANRTDGVKGSIFTVYLPLGKKHLKPEEIKETSTTVLPATKSKGNRQIRILIADDDTEIAEYIANELSQWYNFNIVSNGNEALKELLESHYDILISDIMMPQTDGIQLLKNIKHNYNISDIPVILLTSKSDVSHRLEGLKKGADAYISKPFDMEELHVVIDNLVDNVRRLRGKFSGSQNQEKNVEDIQIQGNNDKLMERIMKCINDNLSNEDFNVEFLTREVGISRAQLHRKMKEIAGISTADFIRNIRLEQAAKLLKEGRINVTQVAYSVGFSNQTHFSTLFRKQFGKTPTEYMNEHKKS